MPSLKHSQQQVISRLKSLVVAGSGNITTSISHLRLEVTPIDASHLAEAVSCNSNSRNDTSFVLP